MFKYVKEDGTLDIVRFSIDSNMSFLTARMFRSGSSQFSNLPNGMIVYSGPLAPRIVC